MHVPTNGDTIWKMPQNDQKRHSARGGQDATYVRGMSYAQEHPTPNRIGHKHQTQTDIYVAAPLLPHVSPVDCLSSDLCNDMDDPYVSWQHNPVRTTQSAHEPLNDALHEDGFNGGFEDSFEDDFENDLVLGAHGLLLPFPLPTRPVKPFLSGYASTIFPNTEMNMAHIKLCGMMSVLYAAPTGSGKTVLMELAILRLLTDTASDQSKVVYIAPTKALCSERARDWKHKFSSLGFTCQELTGDTEFNNTSEIQRSNLIVTTPEKWDTVTRKWRDHRYLMNMLRLVLLDEVHILKEHSRGATLEVIVSRMKAANREICVNSTPDGDHQIWKTGAPSLRNHPKPANIRILAISATVPNIQDIAEWLKDGSGVPAQLRVFGDEYRPVQLVREVLGYPNKSNGNSFVFEHGLDFKKSAISAAGHLTKECRSITEAGPHPLIPSTHGNTSDSHSQVSDKFLKECIKEGIAFHHGGTTSTLAVGVNLPAHLVIIKGTSQYINGEYRDYSDIDLQQMIGRAGRPQARKLLRSLHESLIEHLNAEIALGNISNSANALSWLQSTFLYVRIRQNPTHYRLKNCTAEVGRLSAETRLEAMLLCDLKRLSDNDIITIDNNRQCIQPAEYGKAMAKYYLMFESVQLMVKLKISSSLQTVCCLGSIAFTEKKSMQSMNSETNVALQHASRIARCLCDVLAVKQDYISLYNALILLQAINAKSWDTSRFILKQIDGIGPQMARALFNGGISSFKHLENAGIYRIESLANRNPPFGKRIIESASSLPRLLIKASQIQIYSESHHDTALELNITSSLVNAAIVKDIVGLNVTKRLTPQLSSLNTDDKETTVHGTIHKTDTAVPPEMPLVDTRDANRHVSTAKSEMVPCRHLCRDKQKCSHGCCKTGVTLSCSLKRRRNDTMWRVDISDTKATSYSDVKEPSGLNHQYDVPGSTQADIPKRMRKPFSNDSILADDQLLANYADCDQDYYSTTTVNTVLAGQNSLNVQHPCTSLSISIAQVKERNSNSKEQDKLSDLICFGSGPTSTETMDRGYEYSSKAHSVADLNENLFDFEMESLIQDNSYLDGWIDKIRETNLAVGTALASPVKSIHSTIPNLGTLTYPQKNSSKREVNDAYQSLFADTI
ncbi:hypothetical protein BSLG_002286 [Batrachochytrium salamandrivorans]|nr:hypothetical protein BSLG_002286 [Batrachochytrium salamandrivorans]